MKIIEHNCETGEVIERELTAQEISERENEASKIKAEAAAKEAQRQALLDKLGITADEAKLLLG